MTDTPKRGFLTSLDLKLIAAVLMTVDHVGAFVQGMPLALRMIGRLSAPLFFFCLVEGFFHTKSHFGYLKRLGIGAAIMFAGNWLLQKFLFADTSFYFPNIFWSMFLCYLLMYFNHLSREEGIDQRRRVYLMLMVILTCVAISYAEYSTYLLAMVVPFYFLRGKKFVLPAYVLTSLVIWSSVQPSFGFDRLIIDYQWMMVFSALIILCYNGLPGRRGPVAKNFFYVYYPLHIWALMLLNNFLARR